MVPLRARCDARRDELYIVDVHDVEVLRAQAAERATHAAADGVAGVVKVGVAGSVAPDFGEEVVGAAREFVGEGLEGGAEDELGVVVVGRGVEGADAVSVCVRFEIAFFLSLEDSEAGGGEGAYRRASRMVRSGTSVDRLSSSLYERDHVAAPKMSSGRSNGSMLFSCL